MRKDEWILELGKLLIKARKEYINQDYRKLIIEFEIQEKVRMSYFEPDEYVGSKEDLVRIAKDFQRYYCIENNLAQILVF